MFSSKTIFPDIPNGKYIDQVEEKEEGREDISWGRVAADTVLNLLPFGMGKVGKGAKVTQAAIKSSDKIFPKLVTKAADIGKVQGARSVSYTHLTLPTILLV